MTRQGRRPYFLYILIVICVLGALYMLTRRSSGIISPVPDGNGVKVIYVSPGSSR